MLSLQRDYTMKTHEVRAMFHCSTSRIGIVYAPALGWECSTSK